MNTIIYKYQLTVRKERDVNDDAYAFADVLLPEGYKILQFAIQGDSIMLWAEVARGLAPTQLRTFAIVPTGGVPPTDSMSHQATLFHGSFVWHIYG
jgi:hypothetical protein